MINTTINKLEIVVHLHTPFLAPVEFTIGSTAVVCPANVCEHGLENCLEYLEKMRNIPAGLSLVCPSV